MTKRIDAQAVAVENTAFAFRCGAGLLALTAALFALSARAQDANVITAHGISTFGELKYPADFKHLDYVNPDAPKGGVASLFSPALRARTIALCNSHREGRTVGTLDGHSLRAFQGRRLGLDPRTLIADLLEHRCLRDKERPDGTLLCSVQSRFHLRYSKWVTFQRDCGEQPGSCHEEKE